MTRRNFILDTDSYKFSHFLGYPKDAQHIYSYAESRTSKFDNILFFGLQPYLVELANTTITLEDIAEAKEFAATHGEPFNEQGWLDIVLKHGGKIPVRIKAVPEGTLLPSHNVLVTVENTDPTMPWLTSYLETALIRIWYPITVATKIHYMKQKLYPYFKRSSDSENMDFALLDFGSRGVSSYEQSELGGLAYLASFKGSDNVPAVYAARRYYNEHMAGFSIPATEHSVMTSFGRYAELESFEYLIENMMPVNGILSVVSDTWDVFEAAHKWVSLADKIRNKNGTIVVRPDSGDMRSNVPKLLKIISEGFGVTRNNKGYNVINNAKILQGDGIDDETLTIPFNAAQFAGISSDSVLVGSGGGILQSGINRDTLGFAFKASNVTRSGIDYPIRKDPVTDTKKRSKAGRLKLVAYGAKDGTNSYTTLVDDGTPFFNAHQDSLKLVYEDGVLFNQQSMTEIRNRISNQ